MDFLDAIPLTFKVICIQCCYKHVYKILEWKLYPEVSNKTQNNGEY